MGNNYEVENKIAAVYSDDSNNHKQLCARKTAKLSECCVANIFLSVTSLKTNFAPVWYKYITI